MPERMGLLRVSSTRPIPPGSTVRDIVSGRTVEPDKPQDVIDAVEDAVRMTRRKVPVATMPSVGAGLPGTRAVRRGRAAITSPWP